MKEWTLKGTQAQKLNELISCCDGLLLLLESSRGVSEEESESAFRSPFILPGKVIRAEWDKSSSLGGNMRSRPQRSE